LKTEIVSTREQLKQALAVRKEVFVREQGISAELERDEYDDGPERCVHFLLTDDEGVAIGTARMKPFDGKSAKLQRIAVLPLWRGRGLGRLLVDAMERQAARGGYRYAVLDAQVAAAAFYGKLGYEIISDKPFDDAGIEHVRMSKRLSGAT